MRSIPLEVATEGRICRPAITHDCSREVLAEDFRGNITSSTLPDRIQRVVLGSERPDPRLLAVSFDSGFVNVDNVGLLDLAADLFVFTATGAAARSVACHADAPDSSSPWSCLKRSPIFRQGRRWSYREREPPRR